MNLKKTISLLAVIMLITAWGCGRKNFRKEFSEQMKYSLELLVESGGTIEGKKIRNIDLISRVYDTNNYPIKSRWDDVENIDQMLISIRSSRDHGLNPEDYHLSGIYELIDKVLLAGKVSADDKVLLELLLTDSFLTLASHLASGKVSRYEPVWTASERVTGIDRKDFLDSTLISRKISDNLYGLTPGDPGYTGLVEALKKYRALEAAGGWSMFYPDTLILKSDMRHPDVLHLRERLAVTQPDTEIHPDDPEYFDMNLHEQVRDFQKRMGLVVDGIVGRATIDALNISVYEKISILEAALERLRQQDTEYGDHYVLVNIPAYEFTVVRDGKTMLNSKAIVGKPDRQTPVFSARLKDVELNPYWIIPPGMLNNDIIPAVRYNDVQYLKERNMIVFDEDWNRVDPSSVEWQNRDGFSYTIMQQPGYENQLGKVKFNFPNPYHVVIHDTPYRYLFNRDIRAFSSGCVRISTPLQFAEYLLREQEGWKMSQLLRMINRGRNVRVELDEPVDVHVRYFTSWIDDSGRVNFRKDIYGHDSRLIRALKEPPPVPETFPIAGAEHPSAGP